MARKTDPLARFSTLTREWFAGTFVEPTPAQAQAWKAIADGDNTRQMQRILDEMRTIVTDELNSTVERDLRITVHGWLAFTLEMCRQRIVDPSLDANRIADACAHALLDAVARVPGLPAQLNEAIDVR